MSFILLGILNSQIDAAGGVPAYELLETQILTSTATTVTFTGLGSFTDYKHLEMRCVGRNAEGGTGFNRLLLRLNGDTGNNYFSHFLRGSGTAVDSGGGQGTSINPATNVFPSASSAADAFGVSLMSFLDFSSTTKNKTVRIFQGSAAVRAEDLGNISLNSGMRNNTAAITSITIGEGSGTGFVAGSRFSLYGIRGE